MIKIKKKNKEETENSKIHTADKTKEEERGKKCWW